MRDLSNTKWMAASCGVLCLAALLATGIKLSANDKPDTEERSENSASLRAAPAPKSSTRTADAANRMKEYGQLPLAFEPSAPGANSPAKYVARGDGYTLFLTNQEALLALRGKSDATASVRMELAGANAAPKFTALEELPGKSNYFIGNDPTKWRTNVAQYRKVLEHDVYRGVDLVYYGTQGRLEYDFDVAPGTDPRVIQLAFTGAGGVRIDAQGELVVDTAAGEVHMRKPVAYQEIGGSRRPVEVGYALKKNGRATFEIAKYDSRLPLVIDPILSYSTYLGGTNIDGSNAIAVAPDNTAFIAGLTFSTDFPVVHALQANAGGGPDFSQDAFVAKISADGSTLLYSTYLGGENRDFANGIAVDNFGEAYVTGLTLSPHFPVTIGAVNTECGGDAQCGASYTGGLLVSNAFVSKLNAAGSGLIYSTFLGEFENVNGLAIAVDADGIAYVTGETEANFTPSVPIVPPAVPPPPFPITASAFQPTYGGGTWNAFVTKIDATGSAVLYSSYYGGSTEDIAYGIAVDGSANAYITGLTYSTNLTTTTGALQTAYGGAGDGFAAKVNTNGSGTSSLVYSTYIGGSGLDQGSAIALDSAGDAYITGLTNSATFGFTPAGFQTTYAGEGDAFVAKLGTTGALSYFTYLGGSLADAGTGIAVDSSNNAYITGSTVSQNFPTAGAVFQPTYGGGNADSFVAKLDPTGTVLVYSSFLGGTNTELASGIAVDTSGNAYVTGQTCSQDFPLANPLQSAPGGNCDAYVAKISILPGFAFNPAGLVFGAQSLNTTSQPEVITLTNGENAQTISSVAITGVDPGDFAETNTCPASIAVGATCTISVTFTPTALGIRKGSVTITDSAPGSPHVINLSGNTSTVTLSSASLSFGQQAVGTASPIQTVEVMNSGTTTLTFTGIAASGDFVQANNCTAASLYPGTTCLIQVQFLPSAPVSSTGAITLTDSAAGSPQVILATGTGVLEPQAVLNPANLGFSTYPIGTASTAQNLTLSNTGQSAMNVGPITITGDFSQVNNCPAILSQNTSCVISVEFNPTASGTRTGTLTVTDNSGNVSGTTQTTALTGTGQSVAVVSLSSTTLAFGSQAVGTTSEPQSVTVTNAGTVPLVFTGIAASGNFSETDNCVKVPLQPNTTCVIQVTFTPSSAAPSTGAVNLVDSGTNSPQVITTTGTGVVEPVGELNPASVGFTTEPVGTASPAQTVTLTNIGQAALNVTSIAASGDFSQTNNCGATLAQNVSCVISVTFDPIASGTRNGTLTVIDNSGVTTGTTTQSTSLTGTGQAVAIVSLSSPLLAFGSQPVGTTSAPQSITVTNTGTVPLAFTSIAASGNFAETDTCVKVPLQPGTNCVIQVTFTPTAAVASTGAINLVDSGANSPQIILASGTGVSEALATLTPISLGFPTQNIGSASAIQTVTLANTGQASLNVNSIVATGDFSETNNCGAILAQNTSCAINVTFTPTVAGSRTGTLTVSDNSSNGTTQTVQLSGVGQVVAAVTLSPSSLTFGATNPGVTSAAQVVTITNSGSAPLTVSSVSITGDFAQMNDCSANIPAGSSCTMSVTFTPTAFGSRFGTITIVDNAATSPQSIPLSGLTTSMPVPVLSTTTLTFASQNVQTISPAQNVYFANGGNVALTIGGITATGDFAQTNNCGTSLAPNAACTIVVTFTPTAAGTRTGLITIADNATPPTQAVQLTGTGATFQISATSNSAVSIPAGQTATIPVTISASAGFTQAVTLSCTLPSGVGTCAIAPQTVSPTAAAAQTATLTVTTMVRNMAPPVTGIKNNPFGGLRHFTMPWLAWLAMILAVLTIAAIRQRPLSAAFGFAMVLLLASVACGGAGTAQAPGAASGTPAGTYQVTVTGTSGSVSSSMQFTLQVN